MTKFGLAGWIMLVVGCASLANPTPENRQAWLSLNQLVPRHVPVSAIAVNARDSDQIFAATYSRVGIYTSQGGLGNWRPDSNGLPKAPVFALLAMPDEMFAGTAAGLYRRAYSAADWQRADPVPAVAIYALAQDRGGAVYAASDARGIWKSDDRGTTWTRIKGLDDEPLLRILPLDAHTIFAGTAGHGLLVTRDAGQTWNSISEFEGAYINVILQDSRDPRTIYVAPRGGLYRSRDAGLTWEGLGGRIAKEVVHTLLVSPKRQELIVGTDARGLWTSRDEGKSWQEEASTDGAIAFPPKRAILTITAQGNAIYVGTEDGVVKSSDSGASWSPTDPLERGIGVPTIYSMAFVPATQSLWTATQDGLYGGPLSWRRAVLGDNDAPTTAVAVAPSDPKRIYVGTDGKGVFVSNDSGVSWSAAGGELGGKTRVAQLIVAPSNPEIVFARLLFERVYKSTDGGDSWRAVWTGMPVEEQVQSVAIAPNDPRVLYAGGDTQFFFSGDEGETWQARGLKGISTLALWIDPNDSKKVWAGGTDGLYVSEDAGNSWRGPLMPGTTVASVVRDAHGKFYLGTKYNGIFFTDAAARVFTSFGTGLEGVSVEGIALNDQAGVIFAATSEGLFCTLLNPENRGPGVDGISC